jgi:hypothetical protein
MAGSPSKGVAKGEDGVLEENRPTDEYCALSCASSVRFSLSSMMKQLVHGVLMVMTYNSLDGVLQPMQKMLHHHLNRLTNSSMLQ